MRLAVVKGFAFGSHRVFQGETMLFLKGIGSVNSGIGRSLYVRYRYQLWDVLAKALASERSHLVNALSGLKAPLLFRRA